MNSCQDITELELTELSSLLKQMGGEPFTASQIYQWIYKRGVTDFGQMTDLPLALRTRMAESCIVQTPKIVRTDNSRDGTVKFLLSHTDNQCVEAVFIPDTPRMTFCISTQVGCAMHCAFCLTGKMGLIRNCSTGEIVGQVRILADKLKLLNTAFNIVFMGMGEPLHNYDRTLKAIRILTDKRGLAVPARRITLSTVGVPDALERLATEPLMPNLAISLHATTEELRDRLVPVNHNYGLSEILASCKRLPYTRRRRITFEYVLLKNINDSVDDAERLSQLVTGIQAKVNVIPLNEAPEIPYQRPSDAKINQFARILSKRGVTVSVRKSRGRDIRAACGQLITKV